MNLDLNRAMSPMRLIIMGTKLENRTPSEKEKIILILVLIWWLFYKTYFNLFVATKVFGSNLDNLTLATGQNSTILVNTTRKLDLNVMAFLVTSNL